MVPSHDAIVGQARRRRARQPFTEPTRRTRAAVGRRRRPAQVVVVAPRITRGAATRVRRAAARPGRAARAPARSALDAGASDVGGGRRRRRRASAVCQLTSPRVAAGRGGGGGGLHDFLEAEEEAEAEAKERSGGGGGRRLGEAGESAATATTAPARCRRRRRVQAARRTRRPRRRRRPEPAAAARRRLGGCRWRPSAAAEGGMPKADGGPSEGECFRGCRGGRPGGADAADPRALLHLYEVRGVLHGAWAPATGRFLVDRASASHGRGPPRARVLAALKAARAGSPPPLLPTGCPRSRAARRLRACAARTLTVGVDAASSHAQQTGASRAAAAPLRGASLCTARPTARRPSLGSSTRARLRPLPSRP